MSIYIGLSSNLDDPPARILEALERLQAGPAMRVARCSSLYRTAPWGIEDQPDFANAVAEIETPLPPRELLERLIRIEEAMGRQRKNTPKWGPRRIDLDLLTYNDRRIDEPGLTVPHPWIRKRDFVLAPLLEIAPGILEPGTGRPYAESFAGLEQSTGIHAVEPPPVVSNDGSGIAGPGALSLHSHSPEETQEIGRRLAERLNGGETLALEGPLGAGKTCFAQGVAKGLNVAEVPTSPTFLLHRAHDGRLAFHHFDFYRLDTEDDLDSIGFYEIQSGAGAAVILVEWADKFPQAMDEPWIRVEIRREAEEDRRVLRLSMCGMPARQWRSIRNALQEFTEERSHVDPGN